MQPDADGVFYYTGMTLAVLKKYDEAVAMFQRALEKNPKNHPVLRSWAELELGNDDPRFRNPRSALERALKAYGCRGSSPMPGSAAARWPTPTRN